MLRLAAGLSLALAHGAGHMPPGASFVTRVAAMHFPAPTLFAWLAGSAEFFGGLLLAAGLFTRVAALFVAGNMAIIMMVALAGQGFSEREKPLLYFAMAVACLVGGPGRYSLDAVAGRAMSRFRQPVSAGRS